MVYMSVMSHTDQHLRLVRGPSLLSKVIFLGIIVGPLGVILFGAESFLSKAALGIIAVMVSSLIIDNYEICDIDKETGEARLTRLHWSQYLVGMLSGSSHKPYATVKLQDISSVSVEEQLGEGDKSPCQVVLRLNSGVMLGITEVFTSDPRGEHNEIVKVITDFIGCPKSTKVVNKNTELSGKQDLQMPSDNDSQDSDVDDEDFEQISKADVADFEDEQSTKQSD